VDVAQGEQLPLIPEQAPQYVETAIDPMDFGSDDLIGPEPDRDLVESIRRYGLLQPVLLSDTRPTVGGALRVSDGRRRVKAYQRLWAETQDQRWRTMPARLTYLDGLTPSLLSLTAHATRRENPMAELVAIERLLGEGASEHDVAVATGMSHMTIRQRLRLHQLTPVLRQAVLSGSLASGTATELAKLAPAAQERVAIKLLNGERVTRRTVETERTAAVAEVTATLPLEQIASLPDSTTRGAEHVTVADLVGIVRELLTLCQSTGILHAELEQRASVAIQAWEEDKR
jgi:ParB-like chromosome segregation protein Spo0J